MAENKSPSGGTKKMTREDRLKAALKANLARRKAQARARTDPEPADENTDNNGPDAPGNED